MIDRTLRVFYNKNPRLHEDLFSEYHLLIDDTNTYIKHNTLMWLF
jgi:hypothetical protein